MFLLTMIARVRDGLILSASMQDDEHSERSTLEYQNQAKQLFRKLNISCPTTMSIETGPYFFHYFIDRGVCFLTLCERLFSKKVAFSYLESLGQEFHSSYGSQFEQCTRPYAFVEFDSSIKKLRKSFTDTRVRRNLNTLNSELQDVQRIMVQNIDDVLQRGAVLSELDTKAQNLSIMSQKYKKDAHSLNMKSFYIKLFLGFVLVFVIFMYFWYF
uniref:Vesicle-trafficking protein SEC22b n=1 Tax=Cacopsylla melanoneura TaxID=428564 RepID=A0A8D8ZHX6_9HEMI